MALLRRSEHVLFVGLLALGVAQSIADHTATWWIVVAGLAVLGWYGLGAVLAPRPGPLSNRRRVLRWWLLTLAAGWAGLVTVSPDFVWLVFAIFLLCLQSLALRWAIPSVLVLTAGAIVAVAAHQDQLRTAAVIGPLIGAAVAIVITVVYRELREEAERRTRLVGELTAAQQRLAATERFAGTLAERERLAHEIHDTVAQGLASILLLLRSVHGQSAALPERARRQLDASVAAAKAALEDTRRVVRALDPAELAGQSLTAALQRLVEGTRPVGIDIDFDLDGAPYELPTSTAVALLRTAQGAVGNVIAHSHAEHARITLTFQPTQISLDVADDGRGFDPATEPAQSTSGTGIGLTAMRTRLREVGGTLTVESTPGSGTAISASIPTEMTTTDA